VHKQVNSISIQLLSVIQRTQEYKPPRAVNSTQSFMSQWYCSVIIIPKLTQLLRHNINSN